MKKTKTIICLSLLLLVAVLSVACQEPSINERSRDVQGDIGKRAFEAVPPYESQKFPARTQINRSLERQENATEWYTYFVSMTGEPLFYTVTDWRPQNVCTSITSTNTGDGDSRIALNGVFYGHSGCNEYYVFDSVTGGYLHWTSDVIASFTSDVPLRIETDRLVFDNSN